MRAHMFGGVSLRRRRRGCSLAPRRAVLSPAEAAVRPTCVTARLAQRQRVESREGAVAYSDYGGYAYRNGVRVIDRSDAVITDTAESVPGVYPGFAFVAQGMSPDDASRQMHENPHGHAVLGEGPLYVALYKQSDIYVWLDGKRLRIDDHVADAPESCWSECNGVRHFGPTTNLSEEADSRRDVAFVLPDGSRLDVVWMVEDNYYQYARLEQPDGTIWAGWSGYGVGAGLNEGDYGYSRAARDATLLSIWEDAIGGLSAPGSDLAL